MLTPSRRILTLLFLLFVVPTAWSQSANGDPYSTDLANALKESERKNNIWFAGWTAFYSTSIALNGYLASEADEDEDRYDARVSAITSSLGLAGTLWAYYGAPLDYAGAKSQLVNNGNLEPAGTIAERQQYIQSWQNRVPGLIVNTLAGLAIGVSDDRPRDGALRFAVGMLVNEARIRTRPTHVRDQMQGWESASIRLNRHSALRVAYNWHLTGRGVIFRARF